MYTIFLDLETFGIKPDEKDFIPDKSKIKAPANYKKQESIDAYIEKEYKAQMDSIPERMEAQWRKNATDIFNCEIICLGFKHNNGETQAICGKDEKEIIMKFNDYIKKMKSDAYTIRWVTFHGTTFDIPILALRALKYGAVDLFRSLPPDAKNLKNIDLADKVTPTIWKPFYSLKKICSYFDVPVKSNGMDGSKVHDYYLDGRIHEIASYCIEDVDVLPVLAKKLQVNCAIHADMEGLTDKS